MVSPEQMTVPDSAVFSMEHVEGPLVHVCLFEAPAHPCPQKRNQLLQERDHVVVLAVIEELVQLQKLLWVSPVVPCKEDLSVPSKTLEATHSPELKATPRTWFSQAVEDSASQLPSVVGTDSTHRSVVASGSNSHWILAPS